MKTTNQTLLLAASLLLAGALAAPARNIKFADAHTAIEVVLEDGALALHVHDEESGAEYEPKDVTYVVGAAGRIIVPADPAFGFLGVPGASAWVISQTETEGLPVIALGAEEIEAGLFVGDALVLSLVKVKGPGAVSVFTLDGFGFPTVEMYSGDGVTAADSLGLAAGVHDHVNLGFTAAGKYTVTLEARGTLVDGTVLSTGPVKIDFQVGKRTKSLPGKHGHALEEL